MRALLSLLLVAYTQAWLTGYHTREGDPIECRYCCNVPSGESYCCIGAEASTPESCSYWCQNAEPYYCGENSTNTTTTARPSTIRTTSTRSTSTRTSTKNPASDNCSSEEGGIRVGKQCLVFNKVNLSWSAAKDSCEARGQRLANIEDLQGFKDYLNSSESADPWFWTSGTDVASEGTWTWTDGQIVTQSIPWHVNEPNGGWRENCLVVSKQGYFDHYCTAELYYICDTDTCNYYCKRPSGEHYCCESTPRRSTTRSTIKPLTRSTTRPTSRPTIRPSTRTTTSTSTRPTSRPSSWPTIRHPNLPFVKPGSCPPVRRQCPPVRSGFRQAQKCSNDSVCPGSDKCCFDTCEQHHVCKGPDYI